MPVLDVFNSNAFGVVELTAAINRLEPQYRFLENLGLFAGEGIATTTMAIEEMSDSINLLETRPRGGPPTEGSTGKRKLHHIEVPHNPHKDKIIPSDLQNVRAFGSDARAMSPEDVITRKLATMRRKHEITMEYRRWKALEGLIVDADGDTLLDTFTLLGKTRVAVDMALGTSTTKVLDKIESAKDSAEDNSEGDPPQGYIGVCGATFWGKFTQHAKVEAAFANWNGMSNLLGTDKRRGFDFGGVTWVKHIGKASYKQDDGTTVVRDFLPTGDALLIPMGTETTFIERYAPADMMEAVNTIGERFYASRNVLPHGKGVEVYTESNFLPVVTRPQMVIRFYSSN